MIRPFREHHLLNMLQAYDAQQLPLDLFMSNYFRTHKALGSKDRAFIADTAYGMIRWQGLLDHLCGQYPLWDKRLNIYLNEDLSKHKEDESIPLHIRYSFPENLFNLLVKNHGQEKARELCQISNQTAPTTVRINTLKTTRAEMLQKWQELYSISPCKRAENGITFHKKINFSSLPEFIAGCFEIQDEGSQLLSALVEAESGQQIMDYCAGSGGKTLAFAPRLKGSGQIFLHDIRPHALMEARKRLRRAGVQNSQVLPAEDTEKLQKLKKRMDWVLVDAPCSGTGTMRRNPDMKWNFNQETFERLLGQQRVIFEKALSFVKPGGRIVYATCSVLKEENEEQLAHFIKTYNLKIVKEPFQCLPTEAEMDGFFGVVLTQ